MDMVRSEEPAYYNTGADTAEYGETLKIVENLLGKKLDVEIRNNREMLDLIDNPEKYIKDKETIDEIKKLKKIVLGMGDIL